MESIVGKILCDRYRIIRELSQDDFSTIFDAEDLEQPNQPQCQIEKLQPSYDGEILGAKSWQKVLQAFIYQGNILKNISQHPQIPQLLAFFECDRQFYLVREFIRGQTLAQKLEQSLINEAEAIDWLQEILSILDFVHQAGIVHLNIQPSSLIEQYDGKKFLTDFSNVKNAVLFDRQNIQSISNNNFISVEQLEGENNFNVDIYALGKTIIYALTGEIDSIKQLPSTSTNSLEERNLAVADIRPQLATLLMKMVDENAGSRYQSAAEVLDELDFGKQVVTLPPPMFGDFRPPVNRVNKANYSLSSKIAKNYSTNKLTFIWLLLTLPFIIALIIVFFAINKNAYDSFRTYSNDNYQFQIKYPQSWSRRELDDPITKDIVVFSSPLETETDLFLEKVYITIEYLDSESTTLEQYSQTVVERIQQTKGSEIEIEENRKTKIGQYPTQVIVYSRQSDNLQLKQMEAFAIKGDRIYVATYTAQRAKFSKFLDTAKKMINSWEI